MTDVHRLYAITHSLYSGRARAYLIKQGIPFQELSTGHESFKAEVLPKGKLPTIPTLVTPAGEVIRDGAAIIEHFGAANGRPCQPAGPRQQIISALFDVIGTDGLLRPAMHYRWNFPEDNLEFVGYHFLHSQRDTPQRQEKSKKNPRVTPRVMLASTVSAEHFTASFGENILEGRLLENVNGPIAELWQWHSMEELEHKSIAFDVYTQIGGTYTMRTRVMRLTMWFYLVDTLKVAFKILRHDKQLWKWKTLKSLSSFLLAKKGFIRMHAAAYKAFFSSDFHPWNVDSRALLEQWKNVLDPEPVAA